MRLFSRTAPANDHTIEVVRRDTGQVARTDWAYGSKAAHRVARSHRRDCPPNLFSIVVRRI